MDDLLHDFLTETAENMSTLDVEIVRLEQNPNDPELLSGIFRLVHTIKGTCGFLGLPRLERLAHAAENILGKFRDGELPVTPRAVSLILQSMDGIKALLTYLEQNESEQPGDDSVLIAALNAMAEGKGEETDKACAAPPLAATPSAAAGEDHASESASAAQLPATKETINAPTASDDEAEEEGHDDAPLPAATGNDVKAAAGGNAANSIANSTIRVNLKLLETLMADMSELVLARNQLSQIQRSQKNSAYTAPLQRLSQVTSELQEGIMKTRMQPIGNAWAKLPRIVRDLARELDKKINLQMIGAETELDRQVLELIKDPLTHMVRNSADHGIEMPAERVKARKTEFGTILLNAYHEGGHIIIDISDDGRGLPLDKIKAKILERKLATEAELAGMSSQQILQFIFKPGFSTATQVTSVSGRGVGMDVVRTNIEKIGGTIDFQSTAGKGSRFFIKIPLTLAIVPALIVECANERFAIPQISVVELVQASAQSEHRVERINGTPVLRLRNRLLPLVSLRRTLKIGDDDVRHDGCYFVVVIQVGSSTFGIIVDRVFDTEEIVVKPVAPILRNLTVFSGNTILGDGSVVMILDLNGIVTHAGEIHSASAAAHQAAAAARSGHGGDTQSLLLFKAGSGVLKAVPLSLVARLEEVQQKSIEYSNGSPMIQYRGKLMPLIMIAPDSNMQKDRPQPIIVFADQDKNMGIVVDEIVDIIEDKFHIDLSSQRPGYLGTSIIAGHATDILDASYYLSQAFEGWFAAETDTAFGEDARRRVLLVDDSPFFRNLLSPLLSVAGYTVTAAENAAEALKLQEAGQDFDIIVSDIEMPEMNGFDFVAALRRGGRWAQLPIVALSSHASPRDMDRGRQVGFTDYVAKFNREALLASLQQNLGHGRETHV
ncbi:MAG: chemotaxis protein CheW [Bdellovibrionales bacterium]